MLHCYVPNKHPRHRRPLLAAGAARDDNGIFSLLASTHNAVSVLVSLQLFQAPRARGRFLFKVRAAFRRNPSQHRLMELPSASKGPTTLLK